MARLPKPSGLSACQPNNKWFRRPGPNSSRTAGKWATSPAAASLRSTPPRWLWVMCEKSRTKSVRQCTSPRPMDLLRKSLRHQLISSSSSDRKSGFFVSAHTQPSPLARGHSALTFQMWDVNKRRPWPCSARCLELDIFPPEFFMSRWGCSLASSRLACVGNHRTVVWLVARVANCLLGHSFS